MDAAHLELREGGAVVGNLRDTCVQVAFQSWDRKWMTSLRQQKGGSALPPPSSSTPHPVLTPRKWARKQPLDGSGDGENGASMVPGSWAWSPVSGRAVTGFGHQFKVFVSVLGGVCGCTFVK